MLAVPPSDFKGSTDAWMMELKDRGYWNGEGNFYDVYIPVEVYTEMIALLQKPFLDTLFSDLTLQSLARKCHQEAERLYWKGSGEYDAFMQGVEFLAPYTKLYYFMIDEALKAGYNAAKQEISGECINGYGELFKMKHGL